MLLSKEPESKLRGLGGAYRYPFQLLDFAIVVLETVSNGYGYVPIKLYLQEHAAGQTHCGVAASMSGSVRRRMPGLLNPALWSLYMRSSEVPPFGAQCNCFSSRASQVKKKKSNGCSVLPLRVTCMTL